MLKRELMEIEEDCFDERHSKRHRQDSPNQASEYVSRVHIDDSDQNFHHQQGFPQNTFHQQTQQSQHNLIPSNTQSISNDRDIMNCEPENRHYAAGEPEVPSSILQPPDLDELRRLRLQYFENLFKNMSGHHQ
eukprot:c3430_g1_i2.p1 GENE.c3430_g1_i2~~c3430_g1_i2.p1  ORF type:complete len:133 (-),score=18.25 c3430_g1_i2:15-413(-)